MPDPVKSEPNVVTLGRSRGPIVAGLLALSVWLWAPAATSQNLLLGPVARRVKAKIELDPRLPSGYPRYRALSSPRAKDQACSLLLPLCVNYDRSHEPLTLAEEALGALEAAYRRLVYGAGLPAPLTENQALIWQLEPGEAELATALVPDVGASFEQAGLVCRSGVTTAPREPAGSHLKRLEHDAWLCVGEAIAARLDAAESPSARRAYAKSLAWELAPPNDYSQAIDTVAIARTNRQAESSLVTRDDPSGSATTGTAMFFEYLQHTLGTEGPAGLVTGLFALSSQPRDPRTARYVNEPDWLDVLRMSLGDSHVEFSHRINAFAAARAQLGRAAGPLSALAWTGTFAPLHVDWTLPVSTLPRRVASRRPLEPLGLVAVRILLDVPTKELTLAMRAEWEPPVPFSFTVVKLDDQEQEIGRLDLAFEPHVTFAEKHITALEGTRSLLILGTNLGGVDATHLLDPDHSPFEPHGCTVYVVKM